MRGDRDADLEPDVRARLTAFRARRALWQQVAATAGAAEAATAIVTGGGTFEPRYGETSARTRRRTAVVKELLATIARYAERHPEAELAAALAYCERIARSENGPVFRDSANDAVVVAAIDAVKGRRFERVYVVDVRAGSFPPYYVPDAFLFSPTWGMIPKESVGEAVTARTAKFTWYAHQAKLRENYSREDRRALAVALARADVGVTVSASGRPTRGVAAPELLANCKRCARGSPAPMPFSDGGGRGELHCASRPPEAVTAAPAGVSAPAAAQTKDRQPRPAIAADRLAEMLECVGCAPRRTIPAALEASFTLLSGRLAAQRPASRGARCRFCLPDRAGRSSSERCRRCCATTAACTSHWRHPTRLRRRWRSRAWAAARPTTDFSWKRPTASSAGRTRLPEPRSPRTCRRVLAGTRDPRCREHQSR